MNNKFRYKLFPNSKIFSDMIKHFANEINQLIVNKAFGLKTHKIKIIVKINIPCALI